MAKYRKRLEAARRLARDDDLVWAPEWEGVYALGGGDEVWRVTRKRDGTCAVRLVRAHGGWVSLSRDGVKRCVKVTDLRRRCPLPTAAAASELQRLGAEAMFAARLTDAQVGTLLRLPKSGVSRLRARYERRLARLPRKRYAE